MKLSIIVGWVER